MFDVLMHATNLWQQAAGLSWPEVCAVMPDRDRTVLCNLLGRRKEEEGGRNGRTLFTIHLFLSSACMSFLQRLRTMSSGLQRVAKVKSALNACPGRLHWIRWTQATLTAWLQGDQCFCYPLWCWCWFFFFFWCFPFVFISKNVSRWAAHLKMCRTTQWMWNVCFPQNV